MRKTQRLLRSCAAMAAASSFGWGQGPTQKSDQSDWSAWSRLPDDPQLAYRVRQDASLKDGYGTAHFIQFKNNGSSAANCEVAVHYTFSKGVPIGPCTYTAIVSLAPTEQSAEKSIGTLEAIQSVSFLKDGLPQGHAAAPDSPPAFTQASVKTVAQDAADKQAQIDQLVQQTSDDAKKIADANAKLAEKEAKDKARFQARQQVLDGLATQILSAKGINPAGPGLATTPTFAPPTFGTPGFGAPTLGGFPSAFGPGAIPILPSSKSLFGSYNLIMRQFSSGAAQCAPYFDLAKALTAGNASQSALLEKVQAGASIVSSVSGLLSHHSKSKDKAAINAETEKNLKVIQKNYEQAKAQADPTIDGLVDKVYSEDFTGINEVMRGAAKDDRTKLVNRQASNGDTPIHAAASEGNLTLIRYFHDLGANLDALDPEGRTPLYRATQFHQADAAMLLLSYKADAKLKPLPQLSGVPPKRLPNLRRPIKTPERLWFWRAAPKW